MLYDINTSQKIILLTATTYFNEESIETLKLLLRSNPDWSFIKHFSEVQGTAPLLYKALKKNNLQDSVPLDVYNYLQNIYFQTYTSNILALEQLKTVLAAFNKEGIKTILLKGMASAEFIYKDLGLRPMGDIDIMVEPNRLLNAENILFKLGYFNKEPYKSHKLRTLNIYNHLNAFFYKNIVIELHRAPNSIHHFYRIPISLIWDNIEDVSIENETAFIINTEKNIQYLSLHIIAHFLGKKIRLNNFIDISELIKKEKDTINWIQFTKECKTLEISLPVYRALSLCKTFLNTPVPDDILEMMKGKEVSLDSQFIYLLDNHPEKIKLKTRTNYLKKIRKIEGFKNKCMYLWAEMFPSKEFIVFTYKLKNGNLFFLFYFVQFFRQAAKSLRNIFMLLKRLREK